jgi:hypothetical protein
MPLKIIVEFVMMIPLMIVFQIALVSMVEMLNLITAGYVIMIHSMIVRRIVTENGAEMLILIIVVGVLVIIMAMFHACRIALEIGVELLLKMSVVYVMVITQVAMPLLRMTWKKILMKMKAFHLMCTQ